MNNDKENTMDMNSFLNDDDAPIIAHCERCRNTGNLVPVNENWDIFLCQLCINDINKENTTMNTTTIPTCNAKTSENIPCTNKGKFTVEVEFHSSTAYLRNHTPKAFMKPGEVWATADLHVCGVHYNTLVTNPRHCVTLAYQPIITTSNDTRFVPKEDTMTTTNIDPEEAAENAEFDRLHSYDTVLSLFNGRPVKTTPLTHGGFAMADDCGHDECVSNFVELFHEMNAETCCGEKCNHYYPMFCLNPTKKEETKPMTTTKTHSIPCGICHGRHHTVEEVKACSGGHRVTHPIPCGNCRKNGVPNPTHATVEEVKACYANKES